MNKRQMQERTAAIEAQVVATVTLYNEARPRQRADGRPWSEYPLGTIAHDVGGGYWTRTAQGWKANGGDTFPTPAASAFYVTLP